MIYEDMGVIDYSQAWQYPETGYPGLSLFQNKQSFTRTKTHKLKRFQPQESEQSEEIKLKYFHISNFNRRI